MSKKYDQIFVNGDSYTALTKEHQVYSEFIQQELNIPVHNHAAQGTSNHRIIRTSVELLPEIRKANPNDRILAIIGLSFIARDEIWYNGNDARIIRAVPDRDRHPDSRMLSSDYLMYELPWNNTDVKAIVASMNSDKQFVDFYTNLFMFVNTLENHNIDYIIFSAAPNYDRPDINWNHIKSFPMFHYCQDNPNIIDLHNFSIPQFAQEKNLKTIESGHMFEDGHKEFSKFLLDKINEL